MEKPMEVYLSGKMIHNYTVCCKLTASNILIVDHNSVRGGLKELYWIIASNAGCPNSNFV